MQALPSSWAAVFCYSTLLCSAGEEQLLCPARWWASIFRSTHPISCSFCAHELVWITTGHWHVGQMFIWLWSFCRWFRGFYWGDASHHRLHHKFLWACKRQERAFWLVTAQCLEQWDQSGPRILDATTLQMILFSNHSISAGACTQNWVLSGSGSTPIL